MSQVIFNSTLNGVLQSFFALLVLVVVVNAVLVIARAIRAGGSLPTTEEPATPSELVEPAGLFATAEEKRAIAEHEGLVGAGSGGRHAARGTGGERP